MKALRVLPLIICVLAIHFQNAQAQSFNVKSCNIVVAGTSSLHDFESNVETADIKGSYTLSSQSLTDLSNVVVKIPVKAIKSTKGKMMDNKTWDAFNFEKNPVIVFTLSGTTIHPDKGTINAKGTLTMAGVTKTIDLPLSYKLLPGGELKITGAKKLKLTDFKMEPPTAMMGTIKVGDEVEVRFDVVLSLETNALGNNN